MLIMRTSPRVLKVTEKYIASIGRKREELTEEQWNLMVYYVEGRRIAIPFFVVMVLFWISTTFLYWQGGHKYLTKVIPHCAVTISFEDQREPISLSPEEIRECFRYVIQHYTMAWGGFLLAVIFSTFLVFIVTIGNRKAHRILLSRPTATEVVV